MSNGSITRQCKQNLIDRNRFDVFSSNKIKFTSKTLQLEEYYGVKNVSYLAKLLQNELNVIY